MTPGEVIVAALFIGAAFYGGALFGLRQRKPLCAHNWVEVSRTFVDPVKDAMDLVWVSEPEDRPKLLTGFTTILLHCEHCNMTHVEELQGHVHQPKVVPLRKVT